MEIEAQLDQLNGSKIEACKHNYHLKEQVQDLETVGKHQKIELEKNENLIQDFKTRQEQTEILVENMSEAKETAIVQIQRLKERLSDVERELEHSHVEKGELCMANQNLLRSKINVEEVAQDVSSTLSHIIEDVVLHIPDKKNIVEFAPDEASEDSLSKVGTLSLRVAQVQSAVNQLNQQNGVLCKAKANMEGQLEDITSIITKLRINIEKSADKSQDESKNSALLHVQCIAIHYQQLMTKKGGIGIKFINISKSTEEHS